MEKKKSKNSSFPKLVLFFGPPSSGKGTQARLLSKKTGNEFLDAGYELRNFIKKYKTDPKHKDYQRAKRTEDLLYTQGKPALTEDYLYILKKNIEKKCLNNETLVMDKPGGILLPETQWMNKLITKHKIPTILIHLPLTLEESLERSKHRFMIPGNKQTYQSYDLAKQNCPAGVEPIQRADDKNQELTKKRYNEVYEKNKQHVLEIYHNNPYVEIITIDANQEIQDIHNQILTFIKNTY